MIGLILNGLLYPFLLILGIPFLIYLEVTGKNFRIKKSLDRLKLRLEQAKILDERHDSLL